MCINFVFHSFGFNGKKGTVKVVFYALTCLEFSNFLTFNKKMFKKFWKKKSKSPEGFELITYRFVVISLTRAFYAVLSLLCS